MPVRLGMELKPYWLDLPHGVRFLVEPLTTAVREAARHAMTAELGAMEKAQAIAKQLQLADPLQPVTAWDEAELHGVTMQIYAVALGRFGIQAWEGVLAPKQSENDPDEVAPVTAEAIADIMRHTEISREFIRKYEHPLNQMAAEGNVSAPLPGGGSDRGADTAPDANITTDPAPQGGRETTGDTVRK